MRHVGLPLAVKRALRIQHRQLGMRSILDMPLCAGMTDEEAGDCLMAWQTAVRAFFSKQGYPLDPTLPYDPLALKPVSQHLRELSREDEA